MKSKLDITEFRDRLKNNTKIGLPHLQITLGLFLYFFIAQKFFTENLMIQLFNLQ
jgi:hypothetical protein